MRYKETCKWYDTCSLKRFYDQRRLDRRWVEAYCWGDYLKCDRYKMEKEGSYHSDNMMPDGTILEEVKN